MNQDSTLKTAARTAQSAPQLTADADAVAAPGAEGGAPHECECEFCSPEPEPIPAPWERAAGEL